MARSLELGKLDVDGVKLGADLPDNLGTISLTNTDRTLGTTIISLERWSSKGTENTDFTFKRFSPLILEKVRNYYKYDEENRGWKEFEIELNRFDEIKRVSMKERRGSFTHSEEIVFKIGPD